MPHGRRFAPVWVKNQSAWNQRGTILTHQVSATTVTRLSLESIVLATLTITSTLTHSAGLLQIIRLWHETSSKLDLLINLQVSATCEQIKRRIRKCLQPQEQRQHTCFRGSLSVRHCTWSMRSTPRMATRWMDPSRRPKKRQSATTKYLKFL